MCGWSGRKGSCSSWGAAPCAPLLQAESSGPPSLIWSRDPEPSPSWPPRPQGPKPLGEAQPGGQEAGPPLVRLGLPGRDPLCLLDSTSWSPGTNPQASCGATWLYGGRSTCQQADPGVGNSSPGAPSAPRLQHRRASPGVQRWVQLGKRVLSTPRPYLPTPHAWHSPWGCSHGTDTVLGSRLWTAALPPQASAQPHREGGWRRITTSAGLLKVTLASRKESSGGRKG